jgi:DNA-binding NtrC family response regulator
VEDDEDLRKLTARTLKENGYEPVEAASAAEANAILSAGDTDMRIIFADIILRDKNGIELISSLKSARGPVHYVFTSGYVGTGAHDPEFITTQGHKFIQKPYSIEAVLKIFKDLLTKPKA